jgi:hypothetical protein
MGGGVADYDNDGWVDVFITAVGGNRLFRNEGNGRFRDVTEEAGVGGTPILYQWQTNGVDVAGTTESAWTLSGVTRAHDGLEVRVRISNAGTELLSEVATLTVFTVTEGSLVTAGMVLRFDATQPIVELRFNEGSGRVTANPRQGWGGPLRRRPGCVIHR